VGTPDTDLASATKALLRLVTSRTRGLLFDARIHSSHAYRHKRRRATESFPLITSSGEIPNATDRKKSPWREVAPAINTQLLSRSASLASAGSPA